MPTRKPGGYIDWTKVPPYNPALEKGLDVFYLNYIQYPINSSVKKPHVPTLNKIDRLVYSGAKQIELENFLEVFLIKVETDRRLTYDVIEHTLGLLNDLRRYIKMIFKNRKLYKKITETGNGLTEEEWAEAKKRRGGGGEVSRLLTGSHLTEAERANAYTDARSRMIKATYDGVTDSGDIYEAGYLPLVEQYPFVRTNDLSDVATAAKAEVDDMLRRIAENEIEREIEAWRAGQEQRRQERDNMHNVRDRGLQNQQQMRNRLQPKLGKIPNAPKTKRGRGNCFSGFCKSTAAISPEPPIEITDPSLNQLLDDGIVPSKSVFIDYIKQANLSEEYVNEFLVQLAEEISEGSRKKYDKLVKKVESYFENLPDVQELEQKEQQVENTIAEKIRAVEQKIQNLQDKRTKAAQAEADEAMNELNILLSQSTKPRKYNFNELAEVQEFDKNKKYLQPELVFYEDLKDSPKISALSQRVSTGYHAARLSTEEELAEDVEHQLALQNQEALEVEASIEDEVSDVVRMLVGAVSNQAGDASGVGLF